MSRKLVEGSPGMVQEPSEHSQGDVSHAGKYLTLKLGSEIYGVDVLRIQEIIGAMNV
ncbi:MAG: hypothetical protein ACYTGH_16300, partial [Planctomycetota bacterium]